MFFRIPSLLTGSSEGVWQTASTFLRNQLEGSRKSVLCDPIDIRYKGRSKGGLVCTLYVDDFTLCCSEWKLYIVQEHILIAGNQCPQRASCNDSSYNRTVTEQCIILDVEGIWVCFFYWELTKALCSEFEVLRSDSQAKACIINLTINVAFPHCTCTMLLCWRSVWSLC